MLKKMKNEEKLIMNNLYDDEEVFENTVEEDFEYIEDTRDIADGAYDQYMRSIEKYSRIDHDREKELSKIILHSDDPEAVEKAKEEMITSNLLLVVKQAQRYRSQNSRYTLSLMDVIEEGNIGLMKAVEKYDGENAAGANFGTFATMLIRHQITKAISNSQIIRTPWRRNFHKYQINQLRDIYGSNLTDEKILEESDITESQLKLAREIQLVYLESISSSKNNDSGEDLKWEDWLSDSSKINESVDKKSLLKYLKQSMAECLTEREKRILYSYYFEHNRTFEELGERHGLTRERIRQILFTSIKKMRKNMSKSWNKSLLSDEKNKVDKNVITKLHSDINKRSFNNKDLHPENVGASSAEIVRALTVEQ